jgi:hypothetical protein
LLRTPDQNDAATTRRSWQVTPLDLSGWSQHDSPWKRTEPSMPSSTKGRFAPDLPASLAAERQGDIAILTLSRPQKRNALDDATILGIETFFSTLPNDIKAVIMRGAGEHFSAGLDLGELT